MAWMGLRSEGGWYPEMVGWIQPIGGGLARVQGWWDG